MVNNNLSTSGFWDDPAGPVVPRFVRGEVEVQGPQVGRKAVLDLRLEQIVDPRKAQDFVSYIRGAYSNPHFRARRISFLANQTAALATGALALEPSSRFIAIEEATGVSYSFYANRITYKQDGPLLWVEVSAQPAGLHGTFIWDTSHWDNVEDARWSA